MGDGYEDLQDSCSTLLTPRQYKLFTEEVHAATQKWICSARAVRCATLGRLRSWPGS